MQPILSVSTWVSLSNEVRNRIRAIFEIPRSSHVVVNDGRVETDGTTYEDLKKLTVEKMQSYVGDNSTDFHKLFDMVVAKVTEELLQEKQPKVIVTRSVTQETPVTVIIPPTTPKKRGRPAKIK